MHDPNFPPNLDIAPLELGNGGAGETDEWGQQVAIGQYGIAGRVWEATRLMTAYLTPSSVRDDGSITFDPPCPLFTPDPARRVDASSGSGSGSRTRPRRIIELGSGQSVASLHLAQHLSASDTLVLTDLPEVVPLCQQGIDRCRHSSPAQLHAAALPWGGDVSRVPGVDEGYTHILLCDLIYFPNLYPLLLQTLLELTEPRSTFPPPPPPEQECNGGASASDKDDVFGPTIIMSYKPRTLSLEQSFFDALALYFRTTPVVLSLTSTIGDGDGEDDPAAPAAPANTTGAAATDTAAVIPAGPAPPHLDPTTIEEKLFICQRWRTTPEWRVPRFGTANSADSAGDAGNAGETSAASAVYTPDERILFTSHAAVMNGLPGVRRGRNFGYIEQLFAALEWD